MGIHTWFFTKVERTQEEVIALWIDEQIKYINLCENLCNNANHRLRIFYNWSQEFCEHHLEVLKRQLRRVQNGGCKKAIWNKQPGNLTKQIVGKGLFVETDYHDIFRIHSYSNKQLFSYEETIDFIIDNQCFLDENTFENLIKFWIEYPNGMIEFG